MDKTKNVVKLKVEDEIFSVKKDVLKKGSAYFEAMFSGRFKEDELDEIKIEMISANSMRDILNFLEHGLIDFENIGGLSDIIRSANYLQIQTLIDTIEQYCSHKINLDNWIDIYEMAEESELKSLKFKAKCFGLLEFETYKECIGNIKDKSRLLWYLSHCNLNVTNEYDVFEAGCKWIQMHMNKDDCVSLLEIIYCIDTANLRVEDYELMLNNELVFNDTLVKNILNYLKEKEPYTKDIGNDSELIDGCSDTIKDNIDKIRQARSKRKLVQRPCVIGKIEGKTHSQVFEFNPLTLKMRFEMEILEINFWGYSVTSWLGYKILVVGGEELKTGVLLKSLCIYDTLKQSWSRPKCNILPRRNASIAVHKNKLYIVGGVERYRLTSSTVEMYDLIENKIENLPRIPKVTKNPAITFHNDNLYVLCDTDVYVLLKNGVETFWAYLVATSSNKTSLLSVGDSIFMAYKYSNKLTSFNTKLYDNPQKCEHYNFNYHVAAMFRIGYHIYAYTKIGHITIENSKHYVEKCNLEGLGEEKGKVEVVWSDENIDEDIRFMDSAGSFTLSYCDEEDTFLREW